MKKKMTEKYIYLKIILICIILLAAYLEIAFVMRDQSQFWCSLSGGDYNKVRHCAHWDGRKFMNCSESEVRQCTRGIFNMDGKRRDDQMQIAPGIYGVQPSK